MEKDKELAVLSGEIKTPPFSPAARVQAGFLIRQLQRGEVLSMPHSRPMPSIGKRVHELRINDENVIWRIIYRTDKTVIIILDVFSKKTQKTPQKIIAACQNRIKDYDSE